MRTFKAFIDKKTREAKKQLKLVKEILEKSNLKVVDFLSNQDPYIYLKMKTRDLSFEGVRIYKIGDNIAFRVQKEAETHPYGKAYPLDIEGMFTDLISDNMNEEKAGKEVIKAILQELNLFFEKSVEAEKDIRSNEIERQNDPLGKVMLRSVGAPDFSNLVNTPRLNSPL